MTWRLFGGSRGENVVASEEEVARIPYDIHGLPALSGDDGVRYRNPLWNGAPAEKLVSMGFTAERCGCFELLYKGS